MSDQGDVEIPLGTMKCTLGAAKRVNAIYGDYVEAMRRVMAFNLESYFAIIAAAFDKKPAEVEAAVFAAGMDTLREPIVKYLGLLSNGGRPPNPVAEPAKPGEA